MAWSPHGPMNSLTNCSNLYFPIQESPFCSQLVLHAARIRFVPFFFFVCGCSTLLCRFWQTFCQKCLENHLLQRGRTGELSRFVPGCTDVLQLDCVLIYGHIDKLLAGTSRGAVLCCAQLLVTGWAAAGGTGCFESLLKTTFKSYADRTSLKAPSSHFIFICLDGRKLWFRFTPCLGSGGP